MQRAPVRRCRYTLVPDGPGVDVGGLFTLAGGKTVNNVARWVPTANGGTWQPFLGRDDGTNGTNGVVLAIATDGTDYYFGGDFSYPQAHVAYFDGYDWNPVCPSEPNGAVSALLMQGNNLYAGGAFTNLGLKKAGYVAVWNGGSGDWQPVAANSPDGAVNALAMSGSDLSREVASRISAAALPVGPVDGLLVEPGQRRDGAVLALAPLGRGVYVGGQFANAGDQPANGLARWIPVSEWLPVITN